MGARPAATPHSISLDHCLFLGCYPGRGSLASGGTGFVPIGPYLCVQYIHILSLKVSTHRMQPSARNHIQIYLVCGLIYLSRDTKTDKLDH